MRIPLKSTSFLAAITESRLIMQEESVAPSSMPGVGYFSLPP